MIMQISVLFVLRKRITHVFGTLAKISNLAHTEIKKKITARLVSLGNVTAYLVIIPINLMKHLFRCRKWGGGTL